mgnify:CR=1 FL=1
MAKDGVPAQVSKDADLATELHNELYPAEEELDTEEEDQEEDEEEIQEADEEEEDDETFKQRYNSLKGKYDKEVPRLHNELKDLKQSVLERLGSLEETSKKTETEEPPPVNEKVEEFKEKYGDELHDYLLTLIKEEGSSLLKDEIKPVSEKLNTIEEDTQSQKLTKFMETIDGKVSDSAKGKWQDILAGEDENFLEFLDKPDPSGMFTYGEVFAKASNDWNSDRIAKVVDKFFEEQAPASEKKDKARKEKEALIAPPRKTRSKAPEGNEKKIWTQDDMKQFEKDDRQGKYSQEESMALWNDLLLAPSEGRIR